LDGGGGARYVPSVRTLLALAVITVLACSGGKPEPAHPATPPDAGATEPPASSDAGPPPAADAPLTEKECDALFDHAMDLAAAQRAAGARRPEDAATDDEVATAKARFRPKYQAECLQHTSRKVWACGMKAPDYQSFAACSD